MTSINLWEAVHVPFDVIQDGYRKLRKALFTKPRPSGEYYVVDRSVFDYDDGFVSVPDGPGLGVEVDEGALADASREPDWHNPVWRRADGSVAEW